MLDSILGNYIPHRKVARSILEGLQASGFFIDFHKEGYSWRKEKEGYSMVRRNNTVELSFRVGSLRDVEIYTQKEELIGKFVRSGKKDQIETCIRDRLNASRVRFVLLNY